MTRVFGREERLEHSVAGWFVHADTGVPDFEQHPGSGGRWSRPGRLPNARRAARCATRAPAPFPDDRRARPSVGEQVHHDLTERGAIAEDRAARLDRKLELHFFGQRRVQQLFQLAQQLADVHWVAARGFVLARVRQHLASQVRRALACCPNASAESRSSSWVRVISKRSALPRMPTRRLLKSCAIAAGEHPEAVQPLAALNLLFQPAPLCLQPAHGPQIANARHAYGKPCKGRGHGLNLDRHDLAHAR